MIGSIARGRKQFQTVAPAAIAENASVAVANPGIASIPSSQYDGSRPDRCWAKRQLAAGVATRSTSAAQNRPARRRDRNRQTIARVLDAIERVGGIERHFHDANARIEQGSGRYVTTRSGVIPRKIATSGKSTNAAQAAFSTPSRASCNALSPASDAASPSILLTFIRATGELPHRASLRRGVLITTTPLNSARSVRKNRLAPETSCPMMSPER